MCVVTNSEKLGKWIAVQHPEPFPNEVVLLGAIITNRDAKQNRIPTTKRSMLLCKFCLPPFVCCHRISNRLHNFTKRRTPERMVSFCSSADSTTGYDCSWRKALSLWIVHIHNTKMKGHQCWELNCGKNIISLGSKPKKCQPSAITFEQGLNALWSCQLSTPSAKYP